MLHALYFTREKVRLLGQKIAIAVILDVHNSKYLNVNMLYTCG